MAGSLPRSGIATQAIGERSLGNGPSATTLGSLGHKFTARYCAVRGRKESAAGFESDPADSAARTQRAGAAISRLRTARSHIAVRGVGRDQPRNRWHRQVRHRALIAAEFFCPYVFAIHALVCQHCL